MDLQRILGTAGLMFAPVPAFLYSVRRAGAPPENSPQRFVRRPGAKVAAFLGASIIHGRISANVVDLLGGRLEGEGFQLVNAGLNGDLACNALRRLPQVIACRPDFVVVLVGTNDILATLSSFNRAFYRRAKDLPVTPTLPWYRENLQAIVASIHRETSARVALCSLPMLGEDLSSPENQRLLAYNEVVQEVAAEGGAAFLPVHARMVEALGAGGQPFAGGVRLMFKAMVQRYTLGMSYGEIAASNAFSLLSDGIHLTERAAGIVADLAEGFLRAPGDVVASA
jgi:lysophospholipase L1-like esterase